MAAGRAAETGAPVILLEKTESPGAKLRITGNTRCNLTNTKALAQFIEMFGRNGRFLYGAFHVFFRDELIALLSRYGVETRVEDGGRVFPASGKASDVVDALERYAVENGVQIRPLSPVERINAADGHISSVFIGRRIIPVSAAVLSTGGASYTATGSTGDGYRMAKELGHTIVPLRPALDPLVVKQKKISESLQGVSLRNVRLSAFSCEASDIDPSLVIRKDYGRGMGAGKMPRGLIESRRGDVMVAHYGLSGPATLLISLSVVDALRNGPVSVAIDLFPDEQEDALAKRLQKEFDTFGKRMLRNILDRMLPHLMVAQVAELAGIQPDRPANQISAAERARLQRILKSFSFDIEGPLSMHTAFVTAGGVALDEIDPKTMESRIVKGLFFAGEVMDLDAETGGYNLQAAFSTGYVAGENAARQAI